MGNVIPFRDRGAAKFVKNTIDAGGLKKGEDFEISSIVVIDENMNAHSLGGFLSNSSNELFRGMTTGFLGRAKELVDNAGVKVFGVTETPYPKGNPMFYEMTDEVDIDLATEIGFGVVFKDGKHMLYSPNFGSDPMDAVYEMLRVKLYSQLRNPDNVDAKLQENFQKNAEVIGSLILMNQEKHMARLKSILD